MQTQNILFLSNIKTIHFIGIGGISMSGVAMLLKNIGYTITGSDICENDMVKVLRKAGISVYIGSNPEDIKNADAVVYTAAIPKTDAEYIEALKLDKPLYERAVFIGHMLKMYEKPICIAGMHGKTTTTSMIACVLEYAKTNPTVLVGSTLRELNNLNYILGSQEYMVLEACEYVDSFLNFPGYTSIVLNIEQEHLDYFKTFDNIKKSFSKFMCQTRKNGFLIVNTDSQPVNDVLKSVENELTEKNITVVTYSINTDNADIYAKNIQLAPNGCYEFDVIQNSKQLCHIALNCFGKHNVSNALATIAAMYSNFILIDNIVEGIQEFTGAGRRFELKKEINGAKVYDDYAHHPTEILATINTAKEITKGKIIVVFQPHTYSRTKTLYPQFLNSFSIADTVILTDIYAAREKDDGTISSYMLANDLKKKNVDAIYISKFEDIAKYIKENAKQDDTVLLIGAGTVNQISSLL